MKYDIHNCSTIDIKKYYDSIMHIFTEVGTFKIKPQMYNSFNYITYKCTYTTKLLLIKYDWGTSVPNHQNILTKCQKPIL